MPVRKSLRWNVDLSDPADELSQAERDDRLKLAWTVFFLLLAGIAVSVWSVVVLLG